jgi:hypothetical protein
MSAWNDHGRKSTPRERKEIVRAGLTTIGIRDRSIKKVRSATSARNKALVSPVTVRLEKSCAGASRAAAKALQRRPTAFKLLAIKNACQNA